MAWIAVSLAGACSPPAAAQAINPTDESLRQQERQQDLRERFATDPDVRLSRETHPLPQLPTDEKPDLEIGRIRLSAKNPPAFEQLKWLAKIKMLSLFLLVPAMSALTGCTTYSISNIDKPAPKTYEKWITDGATRFDAKKALLECGAPSPSPTSRTYGAIGITDLDEQLKRSFKVTACMESSGHRARWGGLSESCNLQPRYRQFPACQPNADIPKPSVERRLNSWWCRIHTDYGFCRDRAVNPAA